MIHRQQCYSYAQDASLFDFTVENDKQGFKFLDGPIIHTLCNRPPPPG